VNKKMVNEISKGLKWTFFFNFIVTLVFGVLLFFLIEVYLGWLGIFYQAPFVFGGLFGGALLAFSIASFIAWKETEWEKVKIVVIINIVWNMLGAFIFFWNTIYGWPVHPMNLIHLILFFGFLALFIFFYTKHGNAKTVSN
jgi:hypothetical protein